VNKIDEVVSMIVEARDLLEDILDELVPPPDVPMLERDVLPAKGPTEARSEAPPRTGGCLNPKRRSPEDATKLPTPRARRPKTR